MPQSIPKGLKTEHVLKALAELDAGIDNPFGKPTGYELDRSDRRYPPKAVIGIAYRHLTGRSKNAGTEPLFLEAVWNKERLRR